MQYAIVRTLRKAITFSGEQALGNVVQWEGNAVPRNRKPEQFGKALLRAERVRERARARA